MPKTGKLLRAKVKVMPPKVWRSAPYWRQVRLADGRTGWAAKKFLEVVAAPAVAPAPGPAAAERDDAWLEVHVVDVGQGDGIWIHTFDDDIPGNGRYEGYNIIVDGGPDASGAKNQLDPDYVVVSSGRKSFGGTFLPDATTLERYCAHKPATRIYRTDQDDEAERKTTANDADSDNVIIRTNGKETMIEAYSAGNRITPTSCVP